MDEKRIRELLKQIDELRDEIGDLDDQIENAESRKWSAEHELHDLEDELEKLRAVEPEADAIATQKEDDEVQARTQERMLESRYGTKRVTSIADFWQ